MSFATEKEKASSNKIILAEIDIGRYQQDWLNYCAGFWYYRFNTFKQNQEHSFGYGNFCFGSFGSSGTFDSGIKFVPFDIKSCFVDGEEYYEASSIVDMIATNKSWYYDRDETEFYIHIDKFEDPRFHKIIVGLTLALSNKSKHINNGYYEPKIKGHPVISKTKDPLEFGIIRFDGGSLTLDNEDGFFDNFVDSIVFGQPARILYGIDELDGTEMAYSDYKKICKRYIETINTKWLECQLGLVDYRKLLSRKIPINIYDKTTYPYLADKNIGKSIPLGWGPIYNAPVTCTNDEESAPSNYSFKICDVSDHSYGIKAIDQVYVGDVKVNHSNANLTGATFTLSTTDYKPGQKVTCDYRGYVNASSELIDNSLNILEDILYIYLAIPYNSEYFNQTEWDDAKSKAFDIGLFLEKPEKITEIIEKTALSNFGNFIILDDGRYTFRILDRTASASKTVLLNEYFDEPEIDFDGNKFISKIRIGYAKDHENNEYRWYQDDSLENEIVAEYKKHSDRDFETYLTNETDAKDLAAKFMDLMQKVRGTIKTRTGIQNIEFEVSDIVNLTLDRRDRTWKGPLKTEIIGLKKDLLGTGKVSIEGLVIAD